jgi:hypothetical protein
MELWGKDGTFCGTVCPIFYTRAGERVVLPNDFQDAAIRITSAVCCLGCRHCHLLGPKPTAFESREDRGGDAAVKEAETCASSIASGSSVENLG